MLVELSLLLDLPLLRLNDLVVKYDKLVELFGDSCCQLTTHAVQILINLLPRVIDLFTNEIQPLVQVVLS